MLDPTVEGDTLVDKIKEMCKGPTDRKFAGGRDWVNANNKLPREYFELNLAGMREHERLHAELGGEWLHLTGNLIMPTEGELENLEKRVERLLHVGLRGHADLSLAVVAQPRCLDDSRLRRRIRRAGVISAPAR